MAPKIASSSNSYLSDRYDELYATDSFKSRLHNVVTSSRALTLVLDTGEGDAEYTPSDNSIKVWRQKEGGTDKTDTEIRNDLFFESHNAKKSVAFAAIDGSTGYNSESLGSAGIRKNAGYALATEWTEWINVAESTILVYAVNAEAGTAGPLLTSPPEFRSQFDTGDRSWRKFGNYLKVQVAGDHTSSYDSAATNDRWIGYDILRVVLSNRRDPVDLEISAAEIPTATVTSPRIKSRGNPFLWDLVKDLTLT